MAQIKMMRDNGNFHDKLQSFIENKKGCDVEVVFDRERIPSHSIVLAASSGYFERYLLNNPKVPKQFVLKGVDGRITKQIIQFCCTGMIKIVKDDVIKILKHAHFLEIQTLIDLCLSELNKSVNFENCFDMYKLANNLNLVDLMDNAYKFIKNIADKNHNIPKMPSYELSKTSSTKQKNSIVVLGGRTNEQCNVVEKFDIRTDSWITEERKWDRNSFRCVFIEDRILVIGGQIDDMPTSIVESLNPKDWTKTALSPMKQARWRFSAVKVGTSVFVFGGDKKFNVALSSVERFNTTTGIWSPIDPMPTARLFNQAVTIGDNIYVIGGWNKVDLNVNECYSVTTRTWKTYAPMQEIRYSPGVDTHNGFVYVVGGFADSKSLSIAERYDPKLDKWTYIKSIPYPCYSMPTAVFENQLVISGGYSGECLATVRQYDFEKDQWAPLPPLNIARTSHNMILIPSNLLD